MLEGARRVDIWVLRHGTAPLSGSFRLTFRGATTVAIDVDDSAGLVETKLTDLDTIEAGGVNVSKVMDVDPFANGIERMWAVTFIGAGVGGNVPSLSVLPTDNDLTGSNVSLNIYSDGAESASDRRATAEAASFMGNELGGSFTLSLRGHETTPIEFNAGATTMKARLEALPNVGVVDVQVSAPTPQRGYTWTVSFVSNPGYFPVNARDVADFTWDAASALTGNGSSVNQSTLVEGSEPLSGTFQLGFRASPTGGLNVTDDLAYDISAGALEASMRRCGKVAATRRTYHRG